MKDDTRFKPGTSGNPRGRPAKSVAAKLRDRLAKDADQIIDSVVKAALAGDVQAAKLVLERIVPAMKPTDQTVALSIPQEASLTDQGLAVVAAVADGQLAPKQGMELLSAIGTLSKVAEVDELLRRIEALEQRQEGQQ